MSPLILKRSNAFSLIEIIVVIAILSVIASFSYSKYTKFVKVQEMKRSTQNLMTIYHLAKILELKTGKTIYELLPSSRIGLGSIKTFFAGYGLPLNLSDSNTSYTLFDFTNAALGDSCIHIAVSYSGTDITLENPSCLDYLNAIQPTATCSSPANCYNLFPSTM
ncbi:MAG TPA: type II secretion system protein [Candidatus Omnitrophota bacterium]|jgi:prepilin-type N-terminal cleavage/methylation domain-containing protein|nr:type II secretion system protein [Candidatus Omnitrophota bacterium]